MPCQPGGFDPILLSCAKKNGVDRQEEVAQRNPLEGVPLDSSRNKRDRGPSGTPGLPGIEIFLVGRCYVLLSRCQSGVRQTWQTRLGAKKFPLEISLRGGCYSRLRRGPHPHRSPPARIFAEQKCLAAAKDCKFAARQSDRCTNCKPVCNCNPERECFLKPQKIISLVRHCMPRTHGIAQGSADPCVFTRQRKKQFLPGGSTRRFFAQLRSVGSNYPAGRSLPESHWSLDHGTNSKTHHGGLP